MLLQMMICQKRKWSILSGKRAIAAFKKHETLTDKYVHTFFWKEIYVIIMVMKCRLVNFGNKWQSTILYYFFKESQKIHQTLWKWTEANIKYCVFEYELTVHMWESFRQFFISFYWQFKCWKNKVTALF